jgi:hypothetical protein
MSMRSRRKIVSLHRHVAVQRQAVEQRGGVPYLTERTVCARCGAVLDEHPRRLAAA